MRRIGNLWPRLLTFENLLLAYRKARCGKKQRKSVAYFTLNLERELLQLQRELGEGSYQPGEYRLFTIYERKPRNIAAAPFRDRVVHHALMNVIEPPLDRTFIYDSYACRKGKGVHAAVARYQKWAERYGYVLQMDVAQYFSSIDHRILKQKLRRRIKDKNILSLCDQIIDTGPQQPADGRIYFPGDDLLTPIERPRGIPIGNLTSQILANLYLDELDHAIKEQFRIAAYLRYVDDLAILDDDKGRLHELREWVRERLVTDRLVLHPRKSHITPVGVGIDFLGYHLFPQRRLLRNDNGHRFVRKLRGFARGYAARILDWGDFNPSVQSWIGHAQHADTKGLRRVIFSNTLFRRGSGQAPTG
ncbi:MAG: RNA-dependent DNA polymerase [Gammaproteobacteria bacterium]|jgi:RNA-directed DNA polymerase|nr:RNA-dependent DNA polymerase [Gammaproteobacteria bacterium]